MVIESKFAQNDGVRLHYLESNSHLAGTPLVIVPGGLGSAEWFRDLMGSFEGHRTIAMDVRGCGLSDGPESGYSLEHLASDVEVVVDRVGPPVVLMAQSVGAAYAIAYAARRPEALSGLVILDWPARYSVVPPQAVDMILQHQPNIQPHVARGYQQESADLDLSDRLPGIPCPVLVIRGGQQSARLTVEEAQAYQSALPNAQVVVLEECGHDLTRPDPTHLVRTVEAFLSERR